MHLLNSVLAVLSNNALWALLSYLAMTVGTLIPGRTAAFCKVFAADLPLIQKAVAQLIQFLRVAAGLGKINLAAVSVSDQTLPTIDLAHVAPLLTPKKASPMPLKRISTHLGQITFGRKRSPVRPHLRFANYSAKLPPAPPASINYSNLAAAILANVYENDQLGDCVIAGGYHVEGVATANSGAPFQASTAQIIADYSAIGGYKPGDESTDNGCDEATALEYWKTHGFANGTKLAGYLALDPTNLNEVKQALWLFENLYFGIELPDAWITPFPGSNGFIWDVAGDPNPNNGHCIMGMGYDASGVMVDSWGLLGKLTWAALQKYCAASAGGELWVLLTPDMIAKGAAKAPKAPNGFAWADLVADFDSFGGNVPVPPAPPTPPPPPAPPAAPPAPPTPTAVTLAQAESWACSELKPQWWGIEQAVKAGLMKNWPKG